MVDIIDQAKRIYAADPQRRRQVQTIARRYLTNIQSSLSYRRSRRAERRREDPDNPPPSRSTKSWNRKYSQRIYMGLKAAAGSGG